jgi:hypothetical protein
MAEGLLPRRVLYVFAPSVCWGVCVCVYVLMFVCVYVLMLAPSNGSNRQYNNITINQV